MTAQETIHEKQVMPLLLQACPSFAKTWEDRMWKYAEDDDPMLTLNLGSFAEHIAELAGSPDARELPAVFTTVERLLSQGSAEVREAVDRFFSELYFLCECGRMSPEVFTPALQPLSLRLWEEVRESWDSVK